MEVDLSASIRAAQDEVDRTAASDPTYAELMATYVELGETLEANKHLTRESPSGEVAEFEAECRALTARLIDLDCTLEFESDQRWARQSVRNFPIEDAA